MQIKDIEKLAELAKIELTEEEKKSLQKDMDSILGYVDQIKQARVEDIEIQHENYNVWREDKALKRDFSGPARNASSIADAGGDLIIEQFPDAQPARNASGIADAGGDGIFVKVKKIM